MKRIIALISSLVCLNSTNSFTAFSVSNAADLSAIASSLGADTDYFYNTSIAYSVPDFVQSPEFPINYNSENYAISVLQVLVHNGLISASDIQPGAEVLNDITPSDTVNSLVQSYRLSGIDKKIEMAFGNTYCNTSQEEMVNKLISTAETSMADGKYFVVAVKLANTDNGAHAMVGIGIADGNWTYNNKTYDKCILTLDPDHGDSSSYDYINAGFSEDRCIYINSETSEFYIPANIRGSDEDDIYFVCDDEALLNYKGAINPSDTFDGNTENIQYIDISNNVAMAYDLTLNNDNASNVYHGEYGVLPEDICESFISSSDNGLSFFAAADTIKISTSANERTYRSGPYSSLDITANSEGAKKKLVVGGEYEAEISDTRIEFTKKASSFTTEDDFLNEQNEKYSIILTQSEPVYVFDDYDIDGSSKGTVVFETRPDGVYISDSEMLQVQFDYNYSSLQQNDPRGSLKITATEPIMLKYDETELLWKIYRDSDDDNDFESEVQNGDINCDGHIDARDASLVLKAYSELSADENAVAYVDKRYADYNSDGYIDARDASSLLAYYAEQSAS